MNQKSKISEQIEILTELREQIKKEYEHHKEQARIKQSEQDKIARRIKEMEKNIPIKKSNIEITDHALIRYIERELKIDLSIIKEKILTQKLKEYVNMFNGKGEFTLEGIKYSVRDYKIVTVIKI